MYPKIKKQNIKEVQLNSEQLKNKIYKKDMNTFRNTFQQFQQHYREVDR